MTTELQSRKSDFFERVGIWVACVAGTFLVLLSAKLGSSVGSLLLNIDQMMLKFGIDSFFTAIGITFVVILAVVRLAVELFIQTGRRLCR